MNELDVNHMWWRCSKKANNSGKILNFCAKRALFGTWPIRNCSQYFLATLDINWAIGKDREWLAPFLFAPARHKCKTSCPKVGSLSWRGLGMCCTVALPIENGDNPKMSPNPITIGKYTVTQRGHFWTRSFALVRSWSEEKDSKSLAVFSYGSADVRSSLKTLRTALNRPCTKKDTFRVKK